MKLTVHFPMDHLAYKTKHLLSRMLNPLCGIDHEIGFVLHSSRDASVIVTGAELTGVHTLLKLPNPKRGAYHLGGCGIQLDEAIIRTLGETVERYSQVISEVAGIKEIQFASYQQMLSFDEKVISLDKINYYLSQQYFQNGFPFELFGYDQPVTWVKLYSLLGRHYLWVPAQLVFVGYQIKHDKLEPWISTAVTTGTAAHTDRNRALINAIMELIQIDSAMGHWYSSQVAPKIEFDKRTSALVEIINKHAAHQRNVFTFHWLKNADLPGFSVACVYRGLEKSIPATAIGLGADLCLESAMYKAFLEAVGVVSLSRMTIFDGQYHLQGNSIHPKEIYDLDSNVAYYALGNSDELIKQKFSINTKIAASALPPDIKQSDEENLKDLLQAFATTNKELLFYDLTGVEAKSLGFVVPRVWSPDLLPLCLPSAPFLNHQRYLSYGGAQHDNPHPYP